MERERSGLMPESKKKLSLLVPARHRAGASAKPALARTDARSARAPRRKRTAKELGTARNSTPLRGMVTGISTSVVTFIQVAPFRILHGPSAHVDRIGVASCRMFAPSGSARSVFTGRGVIPRIDIFVLGLGWRAVG